MALTQQVLARSRLLDELGASQEKKNGLQPLETQSGLGHHYRHHIQVL